MFGRTRLERNEIQEIKYVFPVEYTWIPYVPVWIELAELQVESRDFEELVFGFFRRLVSESGLAQCT